LEQLDVNASSNRRLDAFAALSCTMRVTKQVFLSGITSCGNDDALKQFGDAFPEIQHEGALERSQRENFLVA